MTAQGLIRRRHRRAVVLAPDITAPAGIRNPEDVLACTAISVSASIISADGGIAPSGETW